MKTISVFFFAFTGLTVASVYQGCIQSDHVICKVYDNINTVAFDISSTDYIPLYDSNEVFARKFAFAIQYTTRDTVCKNSHISLFNEAYATKYDRDGEIFVKDAITDIEIYCTGIFSPQYPAGAILNNLFNIPPITNRYYPNESADLNTTLLVTLNEIPAQTDYYTFYVKLKTNAKTFTDTLPRVKLKI